MKPLDKIIVNTLLILISILFIYGIIFELPTTLKIFAGLGGILYFLFLTFHLAFFAPLLILIDGVIELIEYSLFFIKIREKSEIIYKILLIIICIVMVVIVYYLIPIILCMAYNNSFNYSEASSLLTNILLR